MGEIVFGQASCRRRGREFPGGPDCLTMWIAFSRCLTEYWMPPPGSSMRQLRSDKWSRP